ncbi:MAG TPA: HNH endonuclease [Methylotenera sp.]|nr:HNH endonuclease [Methylotenera sp.]
MNYLEYFKSEISDPNTNYFIFDSKGDAGIGDIDFEKYSWETNMYNKAKSGDLIIFRRPGSASETKKFYFYGAAKLGSIIGSIKVIAILDKPYPFIEHIHMQDLESFAWSFKKKGVDWQHFFNQYGMNQIHKIDFESLMNMADGDADFIDPEAATEAHQDIQQGNYSVEDRLGTTKIRSKQNAFSNKVKDQYKVSCAVCGIKTRLFLVGSHIVPWALDKSIRLDPKNGICLCAFHDKAFDWGYFTLSDDFKITTSKSVGDDIVITNELSKIDGMRLAKPTVNLPKSEYLKFHREHIFEKFLN